MTSRSMPRNRYMVAIVFLTFFVMSLLTNILGPIVPDIISSFSVSLAAAAFLPFSFFIAYGVLSIPAGFLVERFGEKPVMIVAFLVGTAGSLSFAFHPSYAVAVISLFVMGSAMATLQTAINPLLRVSGGEEHFAFNSAFAQLVFGSASFLSPYLYSYLVLNLGNQHTGRNRLLEILARITPPSLPWASMYWIFAGHGCTPFLQPFPKRGAYRRRASWIAKDLRQPVSQAHGLGFFSLRFCLRWFGAGDCELDLRVFVEIPWLRSTHDRRNRSVLVLGPAHGGLLYRNATAENV